VQILTGQNNQSNSHLQESQQFDNEDADEAPMKLEGVLETIIAQKINEKLKNYQVYDHEDRSCSNRLTNPKTPLRANNNQEISFSSA
jgi:hypothetical protein